MGHICLLQIYHLLPALFDTSKLTEYEIATEQNIAKAKLKKCDETLWSTVELCGARTAARFESRQRMACGCVCACLFAARQNFAYCRAFALPLTLHLLDCFCHLYVCIYVIVIARKS